MTGYTTEVMAVMLYAVLGVVWRPRRPAWVEVALFFVGRPEPVLGAPGEAEGLLSGRSRVLLGSLEERRTEALVQAFAALLFGVGH